MADPFISRDDLGDYLGQTLTSSDKALICVDAACDMCRTISEQTFNQVNGGTVLLDGTGTDTLLLPERPVLNAGTVIESGGTLVLGTDYKLSDNGELYRLPGVIDSGWSTQELRTYWWPGRQNIEVTYSHGYAAADLPRDVRMVALSIASRLFNQTNGNVVFESLGQRSIRYDGAASNLTNSEMGILSRYRQAN